MKKSIFNLALFLAFSLSAFSQTKQSIAVANPNVVGLYATPQIASKLIRLELIKLNSYSVYDEFDMEDIYSKDSTFRDNCLSKSCLSKLGNELGVDYAISGSFDQLGNKIVISLKIIDVKANTIYKSAVREFEDQEVELQRMTELTLKQMHDIETEKELEDRLKFNDELITSNNVGKVKNSGPRIGYAMMTGTFYEFATRPASQGGLDIFPGVSMIGYQLEGQYVGTENFSALIEGVVNFSGLEQGQFMPSINIMNGFRFGKAAWEFAFGPGFGITKVSGGFFDTKGLIGDEGAYVSASDWNEYAYRNLKGDSQHYVNGVFTPDPSKVDSEYNLDTEHGDTRGATKLSTSFIFAFGRTFRAGALNIPVNVFYSSKKGGGFAGVSVGFNVMKSKKPINPKRI